MGAGEGKSSMILKTLQPFLVWLSSPAGISSHLQKLWTKLQLRIGFVYKLLHQSAAFQNPECVHFNLHSQQAFFWYNFMGRRTYLTKNKLTEEAAQLL